MRVTKEKAAKHRADILAAAADLFRARGFDGVGVAEITRAAGLTHGGFYGHFASKDALAAEACELAFETSLETLAGRLDSGAQGLAAHMESYLSPGQAFGEAPRCPMAAFVSEVARQDEDVQARFARGMDAYVDALAAPMPQAEPPERRRRALMVLSALVGALALARACAKAEPDFAAEILDSVRAELLALGDAPA